MRNGGHFIPAVLAAIFAAISNSGAEFDHENFKESVMADCAAFEAANPTDRTIKRDGQSHRKPPVFPRAAPLIPYVCVFVGFDVNGIGRTENAAVVFKSPADVSEKFDRAALLSVNRWRYEPYELVSADKVGAS